LNFVPTVPEKGKRRREKGAHISHAVSHDRIYSKDQGEKKKGGLPSTTVCKQKKELQPDLDVEGERVVTSGKEKKKAAETCWSLCRGG